jgi:hypothetical protein
MFIIGRPTIKVGTTGHILVVPMFIIGQPTIKVGTTGRGQALLALIQMAIGAR